MLDCLVSSLHCIMQKCWVHSLHKNTQVVALKCLFCYDFKWENVWSTILSVVFLTAQWGSSINRSSLWYFLQISHSPTSTFYLVHWLEPCFQIIYKFWQVSKFQSLVAGASKYNCFFWWHFGLVSLVLTTKLNLGLNFIGFEKHKAEIL